MKNQQRLWECLESIPGLAATNPEWKSLLGAEFDLLQKFLRPREKPALSYPCPKYIGSVHKIVTHRPSDYVGVCPDGCTAVSLSKLDIVIYEVNNSSLNSAIAAALEIEFEETAFDGLHMTQRLGVYSPYAGFQFPVYMTIQIEPDDFHQIVIGLIAENNTPFILLAPTNDLCKPVSKKFLQKQNAYFFALSDILILNPTGKFVTEQPVEDIFAEFRNAVLPKPEEDSCMIFFPTPPDAKWEDVRIFFKDGHTVSVKVSSAAGIYNYTQMNMADKRSSNPTKQWNLLESFARGYGTLDWKHPDANPKNQKRRESLTKNLQAFFRIEGEPFSLTNDKKGWQARFHISSDE